MREYFSNIFRAVKSIWIGLAITLRYMGKRVVTVQYPDAIPPMAPRYRGFHEYAIERCIACGMCAKACPVDCITIETEGRGKTAVVTRYAIDYSKCLFCALCVDPCPTECVHMGKVHDLSGYRREDTVVEFTDLAKKGLRTPEPVWLARARRPEKDDGSSTKVPEWTRVLAEHYRPVQPIQWGPVGNVDRAKPSESISWADR